MPKKTKSERDDLANALRVNAECVADKIYKYLFGSSKELMTEHGEMSKYRVVKDIAEILEREYGEE
jgi:hypothetical protein